MFRSVIRFFTLAVALYGAYKALMEFLATEEGERLSEFVTDKAEAAKSVASDYLDKAKERL